eukprot:184860-Pyramimonas_sp.AAC.1
MEFCVTWGIKLAHAFSRAPADLETCGGRISESARLYRMPCRAGCKGIAVRWMQLPGCSSSNYSDHALASASIDIGPRQRRKTPTSSRTGAMCNWKPLNEQESRRAVDLGMEPVSFEVGGDRRFAPVGQDDMEVEGEREAQEEKVEEDSGTESMLEDTPEEEEIST